MSYFNLPISTNVNRFIPKNAFDAFTNAKQKKKFTDVVEKITWLHKLSKETINLTGKEIEELQIFEIKLKEACYPKDLLDVIDKSIPYPIIFVLSYQDTILISTSKKHSHPLNQDSAVVDWSFATEWFLTAANGYQLNLKITLDFVYADFCSQLIGYSKLHNGIWDIIDYHKKVKELKTQINNLERAMKIERQFNRKVELNILLKSLKLKYIETSKEN